MSQFRADSVTLGPRPFDRELSSNEIAVIGTYAGQIGYLLIAWNRLMSSAFFSHLAVSPTDPDPEISWSRLGTDRAKLDNLIRSVRDRVDDPELREDLAWTYTQAIDLIDYRNAVTHLGLNYAPASDSPSAAADPMGKRNHAATVQSFFERPELMTAVVGDIRTLEQYSRDVGIRAMYPGALSRERQLKRPALIIQRAAVSTR